MKSHLTIYFLLLVTFSFAQQNQTHWKSEFDFGEGISLTTFLKVDKSNNQFTITSPKNADVRLFGGFKAKLGRLLGKSPKKGILLTIKGNQKGDSLFANAKIPMFGKVKFKGFLRKDTLSGIIIKNNVTVGTLNGVKSTKKSIDYTNFYSNLLEITHDNIYSKSELETKEWREFQKQLKNLCNNAKDDIELFIGFNMLSSKLPFSHYFLFFGTIEKNKTRKLEENKPIVIFEEKNSNTAYLKIKDFYSSQKELSLILPKVVEKNYQNLIIDLRDNGGGNLDAGNEFAKYITNKGFEIGYFITNKLDYSGFQSELFNTLPKVQPKSAKDLENDLKTGKGIKYILKKTSNTVFTGNLYILTNNNTASTCEPIVYVMKNRKIATIIGEKTAGVMLAASLFNISGKYNLYIPIADFYTYDGVRLEGVGVKPDIETTSDEALNKALALIKEQE